MSLKEQLSHYTEHDYPIVEGDIYVSTSGGDESDGSRQHPFATTDRAIKAVRTMKAGQGGMTV